VTALDERATFAGGGKCSKTGSSADLHPGPEIPIDTEAYNEVKVIMGMVYGAAARFHCFAEISIGTNRPLFSTQYGMFLVSCLESIFAKWCRVNN
jgi:hypothetical protein